MCGVYECMWCVWWEGDAVCVMTGDGVCVLVMSRPVRWYVVCVVCVVLAFCMYVYLCACDLWLCVCELCAYMHASRHAYCMQACALRVLCVSVCCVCVVCPVCPCVLCVGGLCAVCVCCVHVCVVRVLCVYACCISCVHAVCVVCVVCGCVCCVCMFLSGW